MDILEGSTLESKKEDHVDEHQSYILEKKSKFPKKTMTAQKIEKKERDKRGTISRGAHREDQSELC